MKIGEVAERAGTTTKTIHYYESIGLLPEPARTDAGYRSYDEGAVDRLRFVRRAQSAGLSLTEIRSVLELKDAGARSCEHTTALLERQIAEIDDQLDRLRATRDELAGLAARAAALDPSDCTDPNRCQVLDVAPTDPTP